MISALANAIPERIVEIYALAQRCDAAPAVLKRLAQARHGLPMGTVRPPLLPAPETFDPAPILRLAGES